MFCIAISSLITGTLKLGWVFRQKERMEMRMKKTEVRETTRAHADECGSSNRDQILGFVRCQLVVSPAGQK
jgi:hypothetical protein